ncbi:MAG: GIY-YIG nuclease family protein [Deltaproteobacteria bacterium]|nr:GIY-YIG nuclease family protein [Candidatus Tharpella sp.]
MTAAQLLSGEEWISYTLFIQVNAPEKIIVGRLGLFEFRAGEYVYSGSAKRGICARVNRHLRTEKKLHWHIDYLLAASAVKITRVRISTLPECQLVAQTGGIVIVPGFGSSDCTQGCGSHLRCLRFR